MPFVLDASITVSWAFKDKANVEAARALTRLRSDQARVPGLWWFEVRNSLLMGERRGRIQEAESSAFLADLGKLAIAVDRGPDENRTLSLARQHRLTVYDAAYLELAEREGLALATLDAALLRAATAAGVRPLS